MCVVVTSRANYARIKSVLCAIKEHPQLELQLVVGASALLYRFGSPIDIIRKDGFEPNATVYSIIEGENLTTMAKTTGLTIVELATVFETIKPDIVLTVADRYETLAVAVTASYMNIPVAHTQGGEVTGSIDESVRHAVAKLSHIHFPSTHQSAERLIKMGERPETVFNVGCPSIDIAKVVDKMVPLPEIMEQYGGTGAPINWNKPFLLVLQHPVTTEYYSGLSQINETIKAMDALHLQTVWIWPNADAGSAAVAKGIRMYREKAQPNFIHFYRNFTPEDYIRVLYHAACIIGNSSSAIREGSYLGVPCVNIGTRQNGRERSKNVVDVGYDAHSIINAVQKQIKHGRYDSDPLYGNGGAGKRIVEILSTEKIGIQKKSPY